MSNIPESKLNDCSHIVNDGILQLPELNIANRRDHMDLEKDPSMFSHLKKTKRITSHTKQKATTLFVKILGLETLRSAPDIHQFARTMTELFELVDGTAAAHSIDIADRRWDSFILMSCNTDMNSQGRRHLEGESGTNGIVDCDVARMLALALELHSRIQSNSAFIENDLALSIGIASGSTTLLGSGFGSSWTARGALSLRGDAASLAEEMAGLGVPGAVAVHESALWRWAAASRLLPPATEVLEVEGGGRRRAGLFDLGTLRFRLPGSCSAAFAGDGAKLLRRSASHA